MKSALSLILNVLFPVRPGFNRQDIKKIVVFQFGHIGDVVLSLPFLSVLRRVFPRAKVTFVCGSWGREIVDNNNKVDGVMVFNHPWQNRKRPGLLTAIGQTLSFIRKLRSRKYDLSIDLKGNLNTALVNLFSGSRFKAGRDLGGYNYPYVFSSSACRDHEALNILTLSDKNNKREFPGYGLIIPQPLRQEVEAKLSVLGVDRFVVIQPTTPWRPRDWGINNYQALIKAILSDANLNIVVIGSGNESAINNELMLLDPQRVINLSGELSIMETAALISKAEFFLGSDSGPAHIAAALKTPVIALMGPGEYPRFAPFNPGGKIRIIRHEVCPHQTQNDCRQVFGQNKCVMGQNVCMQAIKVEEVCSAIKELIKL